jgi:hypothetical protein
MTSVIWSRVVHLPKRVDRMFRLARLLLCLQECLVRFPVGFVRSSASGVADGDILSPNTLRQRSYT